MIRRLLVANRGEIARRVFTTCRRLGIETVAVHSDADAAMPFVREADYAVRLPGNAPAETYLRVDLLLDAARRTGADAVHPGYGFLSENADFARAVLDAGLVWVGPDPDSIVQMGSKIEAKQLMERAGVPVLGNLQPDAATEQDLPLLVKASAGGGGRGMRVVRALADLPDEVARAAAEAQSAFGDGTVFVEPYVERSRHVEVQVVGDRHGQVVVLGERDCSVQRRHQKVVEEAPAPNIPAEVVKEMHGAAATAAETIGYVGAGTVEFLYDPARERFFFLEMNTRLQVEHPVTECVFGVDLVELQLAVAEDAELGALLGSTGSLGEPRGHAIEVRLYAEDPGRDWQPQSGRLGIFEVPGVVAEFDRMLRPGIRLDSGFESGVEVSTFYDAMLAKVIAWAPTRHEAARMLVGALNRARLHGMVTNRDLLVRILTDETFLAGEMSTHLLEARAELTTPSAPKDVEALAFAAAVMLAEHERRQRRVQQAVPVAWRNVVAQPQRTELVLPTDEPVVVEWFGGRNGYRHATREELVVVSAGPSRVVLEVDGVRTYCDGPNIAPDDLPPREIDVDSPLGSVRLRVVPRFVDPAEAVAQGSLLAPMPGTVVDLRAEAGAEVVAGQPVLVLEAMKMQHTISAPSDGVLATLAVEVGQQVSAGEVLAVVDSSNPEQETA